jgi:hypothetical protein
VNADRRATGQVCIELMKECAEWGEMSDASHAALVQAVTLMKTAEYWSLRKQEPHAGKNPSTDTSIAVSRVALPALEAAVEALEKDDFNTAIDQLHLAITTNGEPIQKKSKKSLVKARGVR